MPGTASLLSKEAQIVLLSAGGRKNDDAIRELFSSGVRMPQVHYLAQWERATLVLWRQLCDIGGIFDEGGAEELRRAAAVWEFRMLLLEERLLQLADAFDEAGIDMMPLKGSGLAYSAYDRFTDRPMNDLDLLVPADQALDAFHLAQEHGWAWDARTWPLDRYRAHHHLPPLIDANGTGIRTEIHLSPCPPGGPIDYDAKHVWKRSRRLAVRDRELTLPSLTDQMIYTCIHFAWMHELVDKTWITFLDIGTYVRRDDVDWSEFVELARDTGADTCAYWTLRLAQSLSSVPVPDDVMSALAPPLPERVLRFLEREYALNVLPSDSSCPSLRLKKKCFEIGIRRGKRVHEMREVETPRLHTGSESASHGFWSRVVGQLGRWKRWARFIRVAVFNYPRT